MVSQLVNSSIARSREGEMRVQATTGDGDNVTIFGRGRQRVGPSASVGAADIISSGGGQGDSWGARGTGRSHLSIRRDGVGLGGVQGGWKGAQPRRDLAGRLAHLERRMRGLTKYIRHPCRCSVGQLRKAILAHNSFSLAEKQSSLTLRHDIITLRFFLPPRRVCP